tara:strand:+ start:4370 stop:4960 length:591 start_codon:yes stop_codon:yes gene_type:complete
MTGNKGKLMEAKNALSPFGYQVNQLKINGEIPKIIEPQSNSLMEVAEYKINQGIKILKKIGRESDALLVEDAGLFIDSLGGFPGVFSSFVLKTIGCEGILNLLKNKDSRDAYFQAISCLWDGNQIHVGNGICRGVINNRINGNNGFGYDPIFVPDDYLGNSTNQKTFGEVTLSIKEVFSHRKKALNELLENLKNIN